MCEYIIPIELYKTLRIFLRFGYEKVTKLDQKLVFLLFFSLIFPESGPDSEKLLVRKRPFIKK